jgi:hypothetical protein
MNMKNMNHLADGHRHGRFICIRDVEGRRHAIAITAIAAICADDGSLLLLPGGRMVRVEASFDKVLSWVSVERTSSEARASSAPLRSLSGDITAVR